MKVTYIETWVNGVQKLGSDFTSVYRDLITQRKLDNAIKKHIKKLESLKSIHPDLLKGNNTQLKYTSTYQ